MVYFSITIYSRETRRFSLLLSAIWVVGNVSYLYVTVNKIKDENRLKDSLFKLTHEIKNPIAVCKGYLDMIDLNDNKKGNGPNSVKVF